MNRVPAMKIIIAITTASSISVPSNMSILKLVVGVFSHM